MPRFALLACVSAMAFAAATAAPVSAQEPRSTPIPCMRAQELARFLEENFGELPTARGLGDGGVLVTMFAAGDRRHLDPRHNPAVRCQLYLGGG